MEIPVFLTGLCYGFGLFLVELVDTRITCVKLLRGNVLVGEIAQGLGGSRCRGGPGAPKQILLSFVILSKGRVGKWHPCPSRGARSSLKDYSIYFPKK